MSTLRYLVLSPPSHVRLHVPQAPQSCSSQLTGGAGVGQAFWEPHEYIPSTVPGQLGAVPPTERCQFVLELHLYARMHAPVCEHNSALCRKVTVGFVGALR